MRAIKFELYIVPKTTKQKAKKKKNQTKNTIHLRLVIIESVCVDYAFVENVI